VEFPSFLHISVDTNQVEFKRLSSISLNSRIDCVKDFSFWNTTDHAVATIEMKKNRHLKNSGDLLEIVQVSDFGPSNKRMDVTRIGVSTISAVYTVKSLDLYLTWIYIISNKCENC